MRGCAHSEGVIGVRMCPQGGCEGVPPLPHPVGDDHLEDGADDEQHVAEDDGHKPPGEQRRQVGELERVVEAPLEEGAHGPGQVEGLGEGEGALGDGHDGRQQHQHIQHCDAHTPVHPRAWGGRGGEGEGDEGEEDPGGSQEGWVCMSI